MRIVPDRRVYGSDGVRMPVVKGRGVRRLSLLQVISLTIALALPIFNIGGAHLSASDASQTIVQRSAGLISAASSTIRHYGPCPGGGGPCP